MVKILVVDDSILYRKSLEMHLEKYGFQVLSVASAEEAMQQIQIYRPEIMILDIVMKGMSGWQMCRQLRQNPNDREIPIIVCSSKSSRVDKKWTEMVGANAHLTKPIDPDLLLDKIKELLPKQIQKA
ncbi:MAG: response regulator [Prochloraceae cyanobacterium]